MSSLIAFMIRDLQSLIEILQDNDLVHQSAANVVDFRSRAARGSVLNALSGRVSEVTSKVAAFVWGNLWYDFAEIEVNMSRPGEV